MPKLESAASVAVGAVPRLESERAGFGTEEKIAPVMAAVEDSRFAAIKAMAHQKQKYLGVCLDPAVGWRFENGEVRFIFSRKDEGVADMLKSRAQQDMLRAICAQVLGQPVKVCVTLQNKDEVGGAPRLSARERASQDAGVEAFRKRFDCTLIEAKDLSQE